MDKKKVKENLLRSRPWFSAKTEEEQAAAKMAATDPELSELKKQQEEFNARVRHELAGVPVPNGLRDQILARSKLIRVPLWRQPRQLLAIAASLVIVSWAAFSWVRPREDTSFAGFQSRMVGFALREYQMNIVTKDMTELNRFLAAKGRPSDFVLPRRLTEKPLKGGASLSWQGAPVSMVCFDWDKKETLYMFIIDQAAAKSKGPSSTPRLEEVKGLATAKWTSGGKSFLLAGHIAESDLASLLP